MERPLAGQAVGHDLPPQRNHQLERHLGLFGDQELAQDLGFAGRAQAEAGVAVGALGLADRGRQRRALGDQAQHLFVDGVDARAHIIQR